VPVSAPSVGLVGRPVLLVIHVRAPRAPAAGDVDVLERSLETRGEGRGRCTQVLAPVIERELGERAEAPLHLGDFSQYG
jgi:hypothetical protein